MFYTLLSKMNVLNSCITTNKEEFNFEKRNLNWRRQRRNARKGRQAIQTAAAVVIICQTEYQVPPRRLPNDVCNVTSSIKIYIKVIQSNSK